MTKEEILEKHCVGKTNNWNKSTIDNILSAMEEYASHQPFQQLISWMEERQ